MKTPFFLLILLVLIASVTSFPDEFCGQIRFHISFDNETVRGTYNGTFNNSGASTGVAGKVGLAYDFERGDLDYVSLGDSPLWSFGTEPLSVTAWINPESQIASSTIFSKDDGADREYHSYFGAGGGTTNLFSAPAAYRGISDAGGAYGVGVWTLYGTTFSGLLTTLQLHPYKNATVQSRTASDAGAYTGMTPTASPLIFGGGIGVPASNNYDGVMDELTFWSVNLSQSNMSYLYNSGAGRNLTELCFTPLNATPAVSYLTVSAFNAVNSTPILFFNITAYNGTHSESLESNFSNGLAIFTNLTGLYNVTVSSLFHAGGFFNHTQEGLSNVNVSLLRLFSLSQAQYTNYTTYNGTRYVRTLLASLTITCGGELNISQVIAYENGTIHDIDTLPCPIVNYTSNHTITFPTEGTYSVRYNLSTTYLPIENSKNTTASAFISDLFNPTISLNISLPGSWNLTEFNGSMICNDTTMRNLTYLFYMNKNLKINRTLPRLTTVTNGSTSIDGVNTLSGTCSDLFGSTSKNENFSILLKQFVLINELTGQVFNLSAEQVRLYYDDNHSFFDFKAQNRSYVNISLLKYPSMRLQLEYITGDIITRYIDLSLLNDSTIRLCANPEGTQHYQQIITSSASRSALAKNVFADCLIAADHTEFAYQDTFVLNAYTIASVYYLYSHIDGLQTFLASIDGSTATYINLDNIIFNLQGLDLSISGDGFAFEKTDINELTLYYDNPINDNTGITLTITREDNRSVVFASSSFTDPNNFAVVFDYSLLYNITNSTIFKVTALMTKEDGSTTEKTFYMNPTGKIGSFLPAPAFVIVLILLVFGMTWAVSSITFGWFGIFVELGCLLILFLAQPAWYIDFMKAVVIIILVFTSILFTTKNKFTVVG